MIVDFFIPALKHGAKKNHFTTYFPAGIKKRGKKVYFPQLFK